MVYLLSIILYSVVKRPVNKGLTKHNNTQEHLPLSPCFLVLLKASLWLLSLFLHKIKPSHNHSLLLKWHQLLQRQTRPGLPFAEHEHELFLRFQFSCILGTFSFGRPIAKKAVTTSHGFIANSCFSSRYKLPGSLKGRALLHVEEP